MVLRSTDSLLMDVRIQVILGVLEHRGRMELTFGALKFACPRKVVGNRQELGTHNSIHMSCGPRHMYMYPYTYFEKKIYIFIYTLQRNME